MWYGSVLLLLAAASLSASEEAKTLETPATETPRKLGIVYFVQLLAPREDVLTPPAVEDGVSNSIPTNDFARESPATGLLLIRPLIIAEPRAIDAPEKPVNKNNFVRYVMRKNKKKQPWIT